MRTWHLLHAFARLGEGDLVVLAPADSEKIDLLEAALPGWTVRSLPVTKRARSIGRRLRWLATRQLPTELAVLDLHTASSVLAASLDSEPRVFFARRYMAGLIALGARRPTDLVVVDFDDLGHVLLERSLRENQVAPSLRMVWERLRDSVDLSAWHKLYGDLCRRANAVLVCSAGDRRMLASSKVWVVPNGTDLPTCRVQERESKILLFVGKNTYPPNRTAVIRLCRRIFPLVQRSFPECTLRIVGMIDDQLKISLNEIEGVSVLGFVDELDAELAAAAVLVVPLTVGGGTRIKILEAFAHGLPVVSTEVGAEGIGATPGEHLVVADSDQAIAAAVVRLLAQPAEGVKMATQAYSFVRETYGWSAIEDALVKRIEEQVLERG